MTFDSGIPNLVSALFLRVGSPVSGNPSDPDENYEHRGKVVISSAIIRRKQAVPVGG